MDSKEFNPLAKNNLGASIANALLNGEIQQLGELRPFDGAGIYAIYYKGAFKAYTPLAEANANGCFSIPIYVGKASPPGARKGFSHSQKQPSRALFKRLTEHCKSVEAAKNLDIKDFYCRYLILDEIWISLGESLLIGMFSPVWNKIIDGFGNHDPGKGRLEGKRSKWDTLHPGRPGAERFVFRAETPEMIINECLAHLHQTINKASK